MLLLGAGLLGVCFILHVGAVEAKRLQLHCWNYPQNQFGVFILRKTAPPQEHNVGERWVCPTYKIGIFIFLCGRTHRTIRGSSAWYSLVV